MSAITFLYARVRLAPLVLALPLALTGCDLNNAFWRFGWPSGITEQAQEMRRLWTDELIAEAAEQPGTGTPAC